jgi:RimJ/RimL family protein N-acetyltransferase
LSRRAFQAIAMSPFSGGEAMTLHLGELRLHGHGLLLRSLAPGDADALAAAAAESRDSYQYTPVPDGLAEAQAYIAHALEMREAGERHPFAIEWRGRVVGSTSYAQFQPWRWPKGCDLQRSDRPDSVEIGYTWLASSVQRTPCNAAAKLLLLDHAFERWAVHSVFLKTDARNQRSRRAIEALGARFDGVLRAHTRGFDCTVRDSAFYSILAAEWPELRPRLEQRAARSE